MRGSWGGGGLFGGVLKKLWGEERCLVVGCCVERRLELRKQEFSLVNTLDSLLFRRTHGGTVLYDDKRLNHACAVLPAV